MPQYTAEDFEKLSMGIFHPALHKKRCVSIGYAAFGIAVSGECTGAAIGRGLAAGRGTSPKHGIKQVDRLLSNAGIEMATFFKCWVEALLAERTTIVVAFDWTEHAHDGHSTIAANLITDHGRATPLMWHTVRSKSLKRKRNQYEDDLLLTLRRLVPEAVRIILLADRGFGDIALYQLLLDNGIDFVIRFRGGVTMALPDGRAGQAKNFLAASGEATRFDNARLTKEQLEVPVVITVHEPGMKEAWFLASNCAELDAKGHVTLYGQRFKIEEAFRDIKDYHFGIGMTLARIEAPERRDRLLAVAVVAQLFLTLLGSAGEGLGLDKQLRANTATKRTHSLFNQGCQYFAGVCAKCADALHAAFIALVEGMPHESRTYAVI